MYVAASCVKLQNKKMGGKEGGVRLERGDSRGWVWLIRMPCFVLDR